MALLRGCSWTRDIAAKKNAPNLRYAAAGVYEYFAAEYELYAYHDPSIPLREEDVSYYRYHPLLLNAAFLGDLSEEDCRILGFGNKTNFQPAFERPDGPSLSYRAFCVSHDARIRMLRVRDRAHAIIKRTWRMF